MVHDRTERARALPCRIAVHLRQDACVQSVPMLCCMSVVHLYVRWAMILAGEAVDYRSSRAVNAAAANVVRHPEALNVIA